ncbi:MAG: hypothetical protein AAB873_00290 [Patescibacteria group bacterium]
MPTKEIADINRTLAQHYWNGRKGFKNNPNFKVKAFRTKTEEIPEIEIKEGRWERIKNFFRKD